MPFRKTDQHPRAWGHGPLEPLEPGESLTHLQQRLHRRIRFFRRVEFACLLLVALGLIFSVVVHVARWADAL